MNTVVLIHGGCAGGWTFDKFKPVFSAQGWDCHAPNLLFHGTGPQTNPDPALGTIGLEDFTDDMAAYIERLDNTPIILGHSMGGVITQKLAARGLARAIVLINSTAPLGILPETDRERATVRDFMAGGAFWDKPLVPGFDSEANHVLNKMDPSSQRSIFDRFGPESGRAVFEIYFWMFDERRGAEVDFAKVACPVLVVSSPEDRIVSLQTGRAIARRYGDNATFFEAVGHGHFLPLEPGAEQVAEYCADWMAGHTASTP